MSLSLQTQYSMDVRLRTTYKASEFVTWLEMSQLIFLSWL